MSIQHATLTALELESGALGKAIAMSCNTITAGR